MYSFSDFETVRALPAVVSVKDIADAIGMSATRTYEIIDEQKIPYMRVGKRIIIFKEHLLQGLSKKGIFTDVAELCAIRELPKIFSPKRLKDVLGISNGNAYTLVRTPGFPAVFERNRILISKAELVRWISEHECNKN